MRVLFSLLLLFIATSGFSQAWDSLPRLPDVYRKRMEQFQKEKLTEGKIVFLGNSITQGGDWKKLLNDSTAVNRGIGGDVTFGVLRRLHEVARFKPSKLFLLIGINDLANRIPEELVLENIFRIVADIKRRSPKTKVYVQSILPVNPGFKNFPEGYELNESVVVINTQLSKIGTKFGYTYIDLHQHFVNNEGLMNEKFSTDGLHLNLSGYQWWVKVLKDDKYL
jgi:lysophospholipase L1-like esterase